ncbi:hypothetical protein ACPTFO_11630, partial [Enterococcus faecium]|uniref:hypothetical protein n=1 Tax=Enterococcus faecium TaxID=1352 RepID=UPI003CC5E91E
GVFSIFFYTKKMLVKFTNIKKYRAKNRKRGSGKNLAKPPFLQLMINGVQKLASAVISPTKSKT